MTKEHPIPFYAFAECAHILVCVLKGAQRDIARALL
eukprot:CAMPEP_0173116720 /NCGR_PEP_ID=MMETSP1102-20130122/49611_1 /TAXON_ID=49646 /ORGANISM="Geminigera sp., Strain Caron Lab Isolate" /LENGTH=35 /DNA_ID= /DNA_START= /DNA_END= /DNA_ORIENTATION=